MCECVCLVMNCSVVRVDGNTHTHILTRCSVLKHAGSMRAARLADTPPGFGDAISIGQQSAHVVRDGRVGLQQCAS